MAASMLAFASSALGLLSGGAMRAARCDVTRGSGEVRCVAAPSFYDLHGKPEIDEGLSAAVLEGKLYMQPKKVLYPFKVDVMDELESFVQKSIDKGALLKQEDAWQPADFLPDCQQDDDVFLGELREMREIARGLPDELLIVLIGDTVTEEALPTYLTLLNTLEGVNDPTGAIDTAWGKWSRQWTAEENRHGDLLNRYLYMTGRVDIRAVEQTIMRLIGSGFDPDCRTDPYRGYIYTSFQERATKISHGNVGKMAKEAGDSRLARICAKIAGDEARHEKAYQDFVEKILECDPEGGVISYAEMMRSQIVMPAERMDDMRNPNLYTDFAAVANDMGVYTAFDYADIMEHLNSRWEIESIGGLSGAAAEAQEYVLKLPNRFRKLAERQAKKDAKTTREPVAWSWLNDRKV